jgi:hypothetical protein
MNKQQTPAASSPAQVDPFNGQQPSMSEYSQYRSDGTVPERFGPADTADSAPADPPEKKVAAPEPEEGESEPDSEPEEAQEPQPKASGAEKRIKQLLAEKKELQRKLEAAAQQDVKPGSSPAPVAQQATRPKPTAEDRNQDGSPKFGTYEDFVEELADWKAEQRWATAQREAAAQAQTKELATKVEAARSRNEDFDEVSSPFVSAFIGDRNVAPVLKQMVNDSDVFADLVYALAGDPKFLAMAQTEPGKAIRHIALKEAEIHQGLTGTPKAAKEPAPPKTQAPKPPSPVGGTSSRAFDVSDESLSPEQWFRKRNEQIARRNKG